jgi:hypothetical protein
MPAATGASHLHALEHLFVFLSFHVENSKGSFLQSSKTVVDKKIVAGDHQFKFDYCGAAGWHERRLYICERLGSAFRIDLIEHRANHVNARHSVGSGVAEEDVDRLPHLGPKGAILRQRSNAAVEHDIVRRSLCSSFTSLPDAGRIARDRR